MKRISVFTILFVFVFVAVYSKDWQNNERFMKVMRNYIRAGGSYSAINKAIHNPEKMNQREKWIIEELSKFGLLKNEKTAKLAETICPNCKNKIVAYRDSKGRVLVASGLGVVAALAGGALGATAGIAAGGTAIPATIPIAAFGFVVGSGTGYIIGDKMIDKPTCPKCESILNLGL